jgi:hypothetical protein
VDAAFREYGKSGGSNGLLIKDLPTNATVRVKIIVLNGSLEAPQRPGGRDHRAVTRTKYSGYSWPEQ